MEAYIVDWLNLLVRWLHVISGVAWIGASFYFIWLDNHLVAPKDPADDAKGVGGEEPRESSAEYGDELFEKTVALVGEALGLRRINVLLPMAVM